MENELKYKFVKPDSTLADFVDCYWRLENQSENNKGNILPDGKIDLFFYKTADNQLRITLVGLETKPKEGARIGFPVTAISFKPLAIEYLFQFSIADILDNAKPMPNDFWYFILDDLDDFELFCKKVSEKIQSLLPKNIDDRKLKLFDLIYSSNGSLTIQELSEKVSWSSRQINRYFNQQFGLSLKAYCNIVRFRSSFQHIKDGKLFPEQNFADQSHFIRDVKKLSGVSPKELNKNQNDRFIQFSTLDPK